MPNQRVARAASSVGIQLTGPTRESRRERAGYSGILVAIVWAVLALIPINFVDTLPLWRTVYIAALALGFVALVRSALPNDRMSWPLVGLGALVVGMTLSGIAAGGGSQLARVLMVVVIGVAAGVNRPKLAWRLLLSFHVVNALALGLESALSMHLFSEWFGRMLMPPDLTQSFRARGFVGHPVPAGIGAAAIGVALVGERLRFSRPNVVATTAIAGIGVAVWATGTRSALALAVLGILMVIWGERLRGRRMGPRAVILWCISAPVWIAALLSVVKVAAQTRLGALEDVQSTQSWTVRAQATDIIDRWGDECWGSQCALTGLGFQNLLDELKGGVVIAESSTVDNSYISILWDFGLVGLVLFIAPLVVWSARASFSRPSGSVAGVMVLLISGFVFDVFYSSLGVLLVATLFGSSWNAASAGDVRQAPGRVSDVA